MNALSFLAQKFERFPSPELALSEPNGLLAVGGDLHPSRILMAYYEGIFPWYNAHDPILWWSPDPRAIFIPGQIHISRSLLKFAKKQPFRLTINHAFFDVVKNCAKPRVNQQGTWITEDVQKAYGQLHTQGNAHSIEVWDNKRLIGGLYGVSIGQVFCGESMFHLENNASKIAILMLHQHLLTHDYQLIDSQIMNPHLESLGALNIGRSDFLKQLRELRDKPTPQEAWEKTEVSLVL